MENLPPTQKKFLGIKITKKKIIWTIIILLVVGFFGYRINKAKTDTSSIQTDTVKKQNLKSTVLTTGQVVSSVDLNLAFKSGGVVTQVFVKEGDKVKSGQILASLNQASAAASLTTARGSLAQAKANYEKVLAGVSNEQIAVAQKAVDTAQVNLTNAKASLVNTQSQQETAVKNAYSALMNTSIAAVAGSGNGSGSTVIISGTYTGREQGQYSISIYATGSGYKFQVSGLESATGDVKNQPVQMGNKGLYVQFSGTPALSDTWTISIPNTYASAYVTNNNAYQAALQTQKTAVDSAQAQVVSAQAALAQAQANLDQQRAAARPADVAVAQAQILSASGPVSAAAAVLEDTVLRAAADGTITQVDIKVGEQASALKEVMVLQDVGNLHAEAQVSEANISSIKQGQAVDYTFDALGPDNHFTGTVQNINPASTLVSGVVNYKVTASLDNVPGIKPGETINMTILVAQKDNVLALPQRAVVNQNGKQYVRIIDDSKKKTYHQVEVKTGLSADGGLVEVTSGLNEGQEIVTYIKQ